MLRKQLDNENRKTINSFPPNVDLDISGSNCHEKNDGLLRSALDYIYSNYQNKIVLSDLAHLCCMSVDTFSRKFSHEVGLPVQKYIKKFRLEKSKKLLSNTNLTVQQIAYQVGLDNQSFFNRAFKQAYSITPKEFRKIPE